MVRARKDAELVKISAAHGVDPHHATTVLGGVAAADKLNDLRDGG